MQKNKLLIGRHRLQLLLVLSTAIGFTLPCPAPSFAQSPYDGRHYLATGHMAPGNAADAYRMAHPELNHHVQPVRVLAPDEVLVDTAIQNGFVGSNASQVTVGMMVGPVYRFKISNIPRHPGTELYPSVEVLGKLNPPPGLENNFPIEIQITQDDLEHAIEGRMVTRVIYLENPDMPLPHRHAEGHQPSVEVGGGTDPLRVAERMGRPMAIMRMGSRIPTHTESDAGFGFHAPAPVILPAAPMTVNEFATPQDDLGNTRTPNGQKNWNDVEPIEPLNLPQPSK
jgi:hypothetical protein